MAKLNDENIEVSASYIIANLNSVQFNDIDAEGIVECRHTDLDREMAEKALKVFEINISKIDQDDHSYYFYTDLSNSKYNQIMDIQRHQ